MSSLDWIVVVSCWLLIPGCLVLRHVLDHRRTISPRDLADLVRAGIIFPTQARHYLVKRGYQAALNVPTRSTEAVSLRNIEIKVEGVGGGKGQAGGSGGSDQLFPGGGK